MPTGRTVPCSAPSAPTVPLPLMTVTSPWYTDKEAVSIWTLAGRQYSPYSMGEHQRALIPDQQGESDLVYHKGVFYLLAVCEMPEPDEQQMDGVLGVDRGIVHLATDSDGEIHEGNPVDRKRQWYARCWVVLQSVGTKSAKRRLRQLSGRQRRFQKDTNHCISKRLVAEAERTKWAIALENLTQIRQRTRTCEPAQRARHSNWAFAQLRQCISYKARWVSVPVVVGRSAQHQPYLFGLWALCVGQPPFASCVLVWRVWTSGSADANAAVNIRDRTEVRRPMVSGLRAEAQAYAR